MTRLSRRAFVGLGAAGAVAAPFVVDPVPAAAAITAQQVVDRIRQSLGVEWKGTAVDAFKAGDPATVVTGIVPTHSTCFGSRRRCSTLHNARVRERSSRSHRRVPRCSTSAHRASVAARHST
jgi:anaerobic selenocysteine-containing dehydrogenase